MEQKEHLDRIVARCRELLAVAEKRTPGRWDVDGDFISEQHDGLPVAIIRAGHRQYLPEVTESGMWEHNATFIASCAGAAEAGWRATIVVIDLIQQTMHREQGADYTPLSEEAVKQIIAAWPEELL